MRSGSTRGLRGFTLIEIIVVVLVFSIMAAMAYGGLNSVLRTRAGIEQSMNRTAEMQRAFQRLRTDFQNLRDRPSRDEFGDTKPALVASAEGSVSLIRGGWRNPMGAGRASLERVAYSLKDHQLQRSSWRVLDLPRESKPTEGVVLDRIEDLRWRFMDASGEWQTSWPVGDLGDADQGGTEAPPVAVELTLITKDWGEAKLLFRTPVAGLAPALSAAARAITGSGDSGGSGEGFGGGTGLLTSGGLIELDRVIKGLPLAGTGKGPGGGGGGGNKPTDGDGSDGDPDQGGTSPEEDPDTGTTDGDVGAGEESSE